MEEERRLFYVGITRAKDRLYLVRAVQRGGRGYAEETYPSRFLDDIPEELWSASPALDAACAAARSETLWAASRAPSQAGFRSWKANSGPGCASSIPCGAKASCSTASPGR